ncbi:hypothetical protein D3C76_1637250 [compost metagenome]
MKKRVQSVRSCQTHTQYRHNTSKYFMKINTSLSTARNIHTLYHTETSTSTSGIFSQEVPILAHRFEIFGYAESMQTDAP